MKIQLHETVTARPMSVEFSEAVNKVLETVNSKVADLSYAGINDPYLFVCRQGEGRTFQVNGVEGGGILVEIRFRGYNLRDGVKVLLHNEKGEPISSAVSPLTILQHVANGKRFYTIKTPKYK